MADTCSFDLTEKVIIEVLSGLRREEGSGGMNR